jgi:hypothetical protein
MYCYELMDHQECKKASGAQRVDKGIVAGSRQLLEY